jgi:hypothetical protein
MIGNIVFGTVMIGVMIAVDNRTVCLVSPKVFGCLPKYVDLAEHEYGLFYRTAYAAAFALSAFILPIVVPVLYLCFKLLDLGDGPHEGDGSAGETILLVLQLINRVVIGTGVLRCMTEFVCRLYALLVSRSPMSRFSLSTEGERTTWKERIFLLASASLGALSCSWMLYCLKNAGVARVKTLEYYLIFVPAGVTFGLFLGSRLQRRRERWFVARTAAVWTRDPELVIEKDAH